MHYWKIKEFTTKQKMENWLEKNESKIQHIQIFVNNGYCIEYRKLRFI